MLPYIGGKSLISKSLIIPNIPNDIETFVECFSGMMWTFFNMDLSKYPNLKNIVYNDFNPLNANLFRCLKNHSKLLEECMKVPVQKKGEPNTPIECVNFFNEAQMEIYSKDLILNDTPNYEVAAKQALILSSVFSGASPEKSKYIDLKGKYHSKFTSFINKLNNPKWQKMFEAITVVENMDFQEVIEKYDSPKTYFYADPPYYRTEKYYANHDFGIETHERLANCLKSIKGKFSLSYYDFEKLSEWFPKDEYVWIDKEFSKASMAKSGKTQTKGVELLIMNYVK